MLEWTHGMHMYICLQSKTTFCFAPPTHMHIFCIYIAANPSQSHEMTTQRRRHASQVVSKSVFSPSFYLNWFSQEQKQKHIHRNIAFKQQFVTYAVLLYKYVLGYYKFTLHCFLLQCDSCLADTVTTGFAVYYTQERFLKSCFHMEKQKACDKQHYGW